MLMAKHSSWDRCVARGSIPTGAWYSSGDGARGRFEFVKDVIHFQKYLVKLKKKKKITL